MFSRNSFENLQPEISSFLLLRVTFSGLQIINVNSDDVDKSSFPGAIDRRWKEKEKGADYWEPTSFRGFSPTRPYGARETTLRRENLGTRLTANVVGLEGLAMEGEGRRTPRPSFFAKRRLRSQLRRLFCWIAWFLSVWVLYTRRSHVHHVLHFMSPLYISGKSVSIKTSGQKERHRN